MYKEDAKRIMPFMKAWMEGKEVEVKDRVNNDGETHYEDWETVPKAFDWDFAVIEKYQFRFPPEKKYRPFKNAEECWNEMLKHRPFGWVNTDGVYNVITRIEDLDGESVVMMNNDDWTFGTMEDIATFADGQPFGTLES